MILTCPECASRYVVDAAKVGPDGRKVRCAACKASWVAIPEMEDDIVDLGAPVDAPEPFKPAPLPVQLRAEAAERKASRQAVAQGVVWAAIGSGFVALMLGAVLFRVEVVRLWPRTAGVYAFAKMPVNPTGLAIETVQGGPALIDGHAALTVSGVERNVDNKPRAPSALRVLLLDKEGKRLLAKVTEAQGAPIPPGESHPFTMSFLDPPQDAASFQVEFAFDAPLGHHRRTPAQSPARLALSTAPPAIPAPAPVNAKAATALPETSPYALPSQAHEP